MNINQRSVLKDVLEALQGTWDYSVENEWTCYEIGKIFIWRKLCNKGKNVLPDKFLKDRTSVTPYLKFESNNVTGGCITLQQQYIELDNNAVVVILGI